MEVSQSGKEELRRELNIALLSGLGIGSAIGSGVYALPGLIASVSGPSSILAVVLMGLITLVLMYIFAKLAKLYPRMHHITLLKRLWEICQGL